MYNDQLKTNNTYKWLDNVKSIFDECGLIFIWRAQSVYGSKELLCTNVIELKLNLYTCPGFFAKSRSLLPSCYLQHPNCIVLRKF